jgi:hypothetical protein
MPYEPIPRDQQEEDERMLLPAGRSPQATATILGKLDEVAVYGFLLVPDPDHPVGAAVRDNWPLLDHRSGPHVALVAFEPPTTWAPAIVDRWRRQLGESFDATWAGWQQSYGLEPGAAYDYLDRFGVHPPLRAADLPCLVLFCDPQERRAVVRPIPDWAPEEVRDFLEATIDTILEHVDDPRSERLDNLAAALTSPGSGFRMTLGRLLQRALEYVKEHPVLIVTTTLSAVAALGTANVLPLSAAAVAALTALHDDLKT